MDKWVNTWYLNSFVFCVCVSGEIDSCTTYRQIYRNTWKRTEIKLSVKIVYIGS